MYNVHPYFSLKNLGKKVVHSTRENEGSFTRCDGFYVITKLSEFHGHAKIETLLNSSNSIFFLTLEQ